MRSLSLLLLLAATAACSGGADPVVAPVKLPLEVNDFRVMVRNEGASTFYLPLATIVPRDGFPVVELASIQIPGVTTYGGSCRLERRFTSEGRLFGTSYGDRDVELRADAGGAPAGAPVLRLQVRDARGRMHDIDTTGVLIPYDPSLDGPLAPQFARAGGACW